ncbi:hypothetical protein [Microbacterium sp. NPDC076911]|uniref:hypothetical protein n=1 Tax=Microbacterium sp. NPDC076911 TaxID=3154958 RepID=UPI003431EB6C
MDLLEALDLQPRAIPATSLWAFTATGELRDDVAPPVSAGEQAAKRRGVRTLPGFADYVDY